MRVLVFTDEYDFGHYTFIYNEIKKLQEAGVEVHVVCERTGKLKNDDTNYTCIPVVKNSLLRAIYLWCNNRDLHFVVSQFRYVRRRKKIIRDFKPDLVHVHFGDTAVRLFFVMEQEFSKYPFLVSFHGFDASAHLDKPHYLERLRKLAGFRNFYAICVSEHIRRNLVSRGLSITDRNSSILYYGIHLEMFSRTNYKNNEVPVFLQISGFYEKKGHVYTLRAFRKFLDISGRAAKLIIGGGGPLKEAIVDHCRELGLSDHVIFPGWISREEIVRLFNNADYFVHHSITSDEGDQEGLPNAIIEAMAMELPVISTFHSGIPELVEDGVNGYLVQEKDIDAYAERMQRMLTWTYLPASREKVRNFFSIQAHTDELLRIYNTLKK